MIAASFRAHVRLVPLLLSVLFLAGCIPDGISFLTPAGPVADAQKEHLISITVISLIVVLPVLIGTPLIILRYRRKGGARYRPDWAYSGPLEALMWGVPVLIVGVLGWQLAKATYELDPTAVIAGDPPLEVQVVGLNWKWLFIYPEQGVAALNAMPMPEGRPVSLHLTSDTVMQSFMIGALGSQIYTMPGMETQLNLRADQVGQYRGVNTQFSGAGFDQQSFVAQVMTPEDFDDWVAAARSSGTALDAAAYTQLGQSSTPAEAAAMFAGTGAPAGSVWFSEVETGLFGSIIGKYMSAEGVADSDQTGSPSYQPVQSEGDVE